MPRSPKEFTRTQRNKWQRQQLEKQKQLKKGQFSNQKAARMSKDTGKAMHYMDNTEHPIFKRHRKAA